MKYKSYFNLPEKVIFCKLCVISNQRPRSIQEFKHKSNRDKAEYMSFDKNGICSACKTNFLNYSIDWNTRHKKLLKLLDKYRKNNGEFDCLVPGSGGKDSAFVSHLLKYKYGMNPLTCTWPPIMYTDYGYKNYKNWLKIGKYENIILKRNEDVMRYLTKMSILNLLHPFQTFIIGQKNIAPKVAMKNNIKLIFYGEHEALYGNNPKEFLNPMVDSKYFTKESSDNLVFAGMTIDEILKNNFIKESDLEPFVPVPKKDFESSGIEMHYFSYYQKWIPQEVYYYTFKNTGYRPRYFRSQGTYSKYSSIDDKIDDLHYYTTYIKFGYGRATKDACQEIRNYHLTRNEGAQLVKKFDGEFPDRYFNEIMDYLDIKKDIFFKKCDRFRSPHLWKKKNNSWKLRFTVY